MTEERLKLFEKAETRINAIIDTLSQDKGGLAEKLKQEDVKDFLISLWVDCATENGIQWHDLRKDPKDLPPKMGLGSKEVYVQYDTKGVTDFACYRFDKNIWERSEDDEQAVGVIAWCEIPQFKE